MGASTCAYLLDIGQGIRSGHEISMEVIRMDDARRIYREGELKTREAARDVDGHQITDDIGNAGDAIRKNLGNAGDRLREAGDHAADEVRSDADKARTR